eukprot:gene3564-6299_t
MKNYQPKFYPKCNILITGQSGAGKSSLIGSISSAISSSSNFDHKKAPARKKMEDGQKTELYCELKLTDSISLWDTVGWNNQIYLNGEFGHMLNGTMENGHHYKSTQFLSNAIPENKIDIVIVVCSQSQIINNPDHLKKMKKSLLVHAQELKIPIIYAVTMVDKIKNIQNKLENLLAMDPGQAYNIIENDSTVEKITTIIQEQVEDEEAVVIPFL